MAFAFCIKFFVKNHQKTTIFHFYAKLTFRGRCVKKNWHIVFLLILSQNKGAQTSQKPIDYSKKCDIIQSLRRKISFDFDTD